MNSPIIVEHGGKTFVFSQKECDRAEARGRIAAGVSARVAKGRPASRAVFDVAMALDISPQTAWTHWRTFKSALENAKAME